VNHIEGWQPISLDKAILRGEIQLGRGNIISTSDIAEFPGQYPIYSSSAKGSGEFGKYGHFMFDEELITWSIDGGGKFFHRSKHKFSVTNVSGYMKADSLKWDLYFLYYLLDFQHKYIAFDYQAKAHPSVIKNLYKLVLLPLQEQEKIADILSTIDRAITQTEAIIAKQQRIKTGLMQDLLTKGIDENGNIRSEATHEFKDSAIGRIPVEWGVKGLREVSLIIDPNPSHRYPPSSDVGVPIASTENFVGDNDFDLSFSEKVPFHVFKQQNKRCCFSNEDIVFARKGRLGFARYYGESEKVFSHTVVIFKPQDKQQIETHYLLWIVRFHDFFEQIDKRMNSNSGVPTLGVQFLGSIPVRIPKLSEQIQICLTLDSLEKRIEEEKRNLSKQKRLKTGLMQDLLTGKVRVTPLLEQEPASR
jgi:type I restriction enzyme, S subunit